MNDLPTELVEEIFLCFASHLHSHPFRCRRSPASQSIISKVCRQWRDIALNFPPLWNHLHVVDPQQPSIVQDLQLWMHRAGTLPLCLSLRQHESYDLQASIAVLVFFLNSLNRCQSFELFLLTDLEHFPLANIERLPSIPLESVNVCCPKLPWTQWADMDLLANLLLNTHSLRTIRWSCQLSSPLIPHFWENLLELSTDSVGSLAEFLNALSQCQNLERLEILGEPNNSDTSVIIPRISLPRVTHLSLVLGPSANRMLSLLILQSLADLEVVLLYRLSKLAPVLDMIQRSGVVLRRLGITNRIIGRYRRVAEVEIISTLRMPHLQELRILDIEEPTLRGQDIVEFLTLPTASNTAAGENTGPLGYLVHLERICLVFQNTQDVELLQGLQKLVKSRLGMCDPKTASEHIETTTLFRFSLSIPCRQLLI